VWGHYKNANNDDCCQVIVADEIEKEDHDIVEFTRVWFWYILHGMLA